MIAALLMMAQDAAMLDHARDMLASGHHCERETADPDEVTVCALRRADRYRMPLIIHEAGDRAHEGVMEERARWLHQPNPIEGLSPFLVGGGAAGVHATVNGSGTQVAGLRPLAP